MPLIPTPILIVEDSDKKFETIHAAIVAACSTCSIERASTMIDAEQALARQSWSLVVLDISLDIAPSSRGSRARGQANVGGLGLAQKMYLRKRECPTVIVTAFDSFTSAPGIGQSQMIGFEEVASEAKKYLGEHLLGCLQYHSKTLAFDLSLVVRKVTV